MTNQRLFELFPDQLYSAFIDDLNDDVYAAVVEKVDEPVSESVNDVIDCFWRLEFEPSEEWKTVRT